MLHTENNSGEYTVENYYMVGVVSACNVGLQIQLKAKGNDKTPNPFLL